MFKSSILFAFVFFVAVVRSDISCGPLYWNAQDSIAIWLQVSVNNTLQNSIRDVSFTVSVASSSVTIAYPNGGSNTSVGDISGHAIGYGQFNLVGAAGTYSALVTVHYKKSGGNSFSYTQYIPLYIDGGDGGSPPGTRSEEFLVNVADEVEGQEQDLSLRTADFSYSPLYYNARDSTPIWQGVSITAGSSNLKNVSFVVSSNSIQVSISYGSGNGNVIGSISSGNTASGSFQMVGPAGTYNLNITVTYKKGSTFYKSAYIAPLYIDSLSTTGDYDGESSGVRRSVEATEEGQNANVKNADGIVGFSFFVGASVGFVACAMVAAVASIAIYTRKQSEIINA